MSRFLVFVAVLSVLAAPLFAQGSKKSSAKAEAGHTGAGNAEQVAKKDTLQAGQAGKEKTGEKKLIVLPRVRIVTEASDGSQIVVVKTSRVRTTGALPEPPVPPFGEVFNVPEGALRDRVKEIGVGSIVSLEVEPGGDRGAVRRLGIPRVAISGLWRFWTMLLVFALLVIVAGLTWGWPRRGFHPFMAFLGKDGLYSNSKFQAALWFGLLIVTYVSALLLRWWNTSLPAGGVSIPTNLLMMSGLSALTFAGAKAIKQSQVTQADTQAQAAERQAHLATIAAAASAQAAQATQDAGGVAPQVNQTAAIQHVAATAAQEMAQKKRDVADSLDPRSSQGVPRFWFDLTHNDDGTPSLSKFQLVVIVLIAIGIYVCQAWDFLSVVPLQAKITLPDVDSALLTAFGLGQGAYLGLKFVSDGQ